MASTTNTSSMGPAEILTPTETEATPTPTTTPIVTTSDGGDGDGPSIAFTVNYDGEELDEGDSATIEATVTDADGSPVEGATVTFMSLGYNVEYTDGATATTNGEGVATKEILLQIPSTSFSKESMPPPASLTMIGSATVNDAKAEGVFKFPVRANCEECHEEGEYE